MTLHLRCADTSLVLDLPDDRFPVVRQYYNALFLSNIGNMSRFQILLISLDRKSVV